MTNEEFQRLVLEKLGELDSGQKEMNTKINGMDTKINEMDTKINEMDTKINELDLGQKEISKKLDAVIEQTADLTEFRQEVKSELADIKNNISRIEIATADNWGDIARLKSVR